MYDSDVAQYLSSMGIGLFNTDGANIFTHPVLPPSDFIPHQAVFIFAPTGGPRPSRTFDGAEVRYPRLQVRVRGDVADYLGGQAFTNQVFETLESAKIGTYIDVKCLESQPIWIGYDSQNHPEWSINVELWVERSW